MAEPKGKEYKKAVSVLLPYLLSHRTRLASVEQDYDDEEEAAKSTSTEEERRHDTTAELSGLTAEQHAQLAEAVDTAILKVCTSHCNLASSSQSSTCRDASKSPQKTSDHLYLNPPMALQRPA